MGHGDHDRAELVQGDGDVPVFPVTLEGHHHGVAPADARPEEHVGGPVAQLRDLAEAEDALASLAVAPDDGPLVRRLPGDHVHHVVAEVEIVGIVEPDAGQAAGMVEFLPAVGLVDAHVSLFPSCSAVPIRRNRSYRCESRASCSESSVSSRDSMARRRA